MLALQIGNIFSGMANFVRHLREKLYVHDAIKLEICKSYVSTRI